ncbi:MAG: secretion protein [Burkholderiaceae bacterium]
MKQLRILTGAHAGAKIDLPTGDYRIGTDHDADVQLTDWPGADALLTVDREGLVSLVQPADKAAAADKAQKIWLVEHVPMPFDGVALCVGDSETAWPDDVALLGTLYVKPVSDVSSRRRRAVGMALAFAMVGSLIVAGSALVMPGATQAAIVTPKTQQEALQRGLAEAHIDGLTVTANDVGLRVTGMVNTAAEDMHVREMFIRLHLPHVDRAYHVAQNDVRSIEDALGLEGARVAYVGDGAFEISGTVRSEAALRTAINRVRADLDSNITALRVSSEIAFADTLPNTFSEVMSADEITYGQTPDGVKHLYLPQQQ